MSKPAKKRYTFREYEQLPEGAPYQLIGGELTMTPSPTYEHQKILATLSYLLLDYVKARGEGQALFAPMDVYLTDTDVYQPDLIYISNERSGIIKEKIHGPPDLIMEILSPSTAHDDLVRKKRTYEEAGVKEYWVADPKERAVEMYENRGEGFSLISKAQRTGVVKSSLLNGFVVDLRSLF